MTTIDIVNENGDVVQQEFTINGAALTTPDGETFQPSVVQRLEYDAEGESSSIRTVCGDVEQRQEGADPPDIVMEGMLAESELDEAKSIRNQDVTLVSGLHNGRTYVRRLTIEQTADTTYISLDGEDRELAFPFQMQLRQPE